MWIVVIFLAGGKARKPCATVLLTSHQEALWICFKGKGIKIPQCIVGRGQERRAKVDSKSCGLSKDKDKVTIYWVEDQIQNRF